MPGFEGFEGFEDFGAIARDCCWSMCGESGGDGVVKKIIKSESALLGTQIICVVTELAQVEAGHRGY